MPYRRSFRSRRKKAPRTAAKKVQRNARYRRSAKSQSKQIVRLARTVSRLQGDLKDDTELHASYRMELAFNAIPHSETLPAPVNRSGIMIIPLTSGPSAVTPADPDYPSATGNFSDGGGNLVFGNCKWQPWVRPRAASATNWMKLYKQTLKVRFDTRNMDKPVTYSVFILRVARKSHGETNATNTVLDLAQRIDGDKLLGNSSVGTGPGFQRNNDYISSVAIKYGLPTSAGAGAVIDTDNGLANGDPNGAGNDVMFNQNYYETVAKRVITVGPQPYTVSPGQIPGSALVAAGNPSKNNMSHDLSFSINYGGAKLSAIDGSGPAAVDQIQDIHYNQINPKLKHWMVICPNIEAAAANAFVTVNSVVSCKLPS